MSNNFSEEVPKKQYFSARRRSRMFAMQAIFQWQHTEEPVEELIVHFMEAHQVHTGDVAFFKELVEGVLKDLADIDAAMQPHLDRDQEELSPVELAVLRVSVYELMFRIDVPYRVVINEALEITKRYGSQDGFKFVNGVLDALAPKLREVEVNQK